MKLNVNLFIHLFIFVLVVGAVAAACKKDSHVDNTSQKETVSTKTESEGASTTHAPIGAKPGSYEDWCGEHQVPESMCTRCNPSLIAAFKATGNWCNEHGLPESQCKLCNPNLKIERPPKTQGAK